MIEKDFDIPFIADLALREKQIQQNYRPIIAVHKWFARRPGTLFRGLLLSEFSEKPLREAFYQSNDFSKKKIADPFMGGGTPLLEANRIGCDVVGFDINPMSYWIVKQEIEQLDLTSYDKATAFLRSEVEKDIGRLYRTKCTICGNENAHVKYFMWVKTTVCHRCGKCIDLFPGYLLASDARHPKNVFVCSRCGQLTEAEDREHPGKCKHCGFTLSTNGPANRSRCKCSHCQAENIFPNVKQGPPKHRLFAIEYHCQSCKSSHEGRFFKYPDDQDLSRVAESKERWQTLHPSFVPDDEIPSGDETNRLHRWGYTRYFELFNERQLLGLELSARIISNILNNRVRNALATNLSDLLRYQNMLCRYDTMALKSLDIFSIHGFPVGLIQCESNFLGIMDCDKNVCIGSGGWKNIVEKFRKAKAYCDAPFEVRYNNSRKEIVPIRDERIGDYLNAENHVQHRNVEIHCIDSAASKLPDSSLDAVFTDPPYFRNVQYAELMDFCYVWLRRLIGKEVDAFSNISTRNRRELTGNMDMGRDLEYFTEGLSSVFQKMAKALKRGAPLSFTYHHNTFEAYLPVAVAILDAGFVCSVTLPCPAEMSASIHINGTESSIIDTIFVCRTTGTVLRKTLPSSTEGVASLVRNDLAELRKGNVKPSLGDTRCIAYGHLFRLAIWHLRSVWDKTADTSKKISTISHWLSGFGGWAEIEKHLNEQSCSNQYDPAFVVRETNENCTGDYANISF